MAVPKSKVSKQRRNKRRSSVWKLENPSVNTCPKCGEWLLNLNENLMRVLDQFPPKEHVHIPHSLGKS